MKNNVYGSRSLEKQNRLPCFDLEKSEIRLIHPSGNVKKVVRYIISELMVEIRIRDEHLRFIRTRWH